MQHEHMDIEIKGTEHKVPSEASGLTWYIGKGEVSSTLSGGARDDSELALCTGLSPRVVCTLRTPRGSTESMRGVRHAPCLCLAKPRRFVLRSVNFYVHA